MTAVRVNPRIVPIVAALVCLAATVGTGQSSDLLSKPPDWQPADPHDVKARALAWLEENKPDNKPEAEATIAQATELWANTPQQPTGAELLTGLAKTFALADENAAALVKLCELPKSDLSLPDQSWLTNAAPPLLSNNMRLLYGRWLIHQELFDESLEQIADLDAADVVAPALLLFCQAAANHTLLQKEAGLQAIERLLDGEQQSPRRYVALARLMQQDLQGLEDDSLDHIARRMGDVRRRLDLGRAGEKVREVERGVIESLDKMIKKMEEQQKKSKSSSSSAANNLRSNKPAQRSQILGGKGPGEVTRKRIGSESGWGDLPPKQREEALQRIGRDFPSHYRDVIEQYFRRLAAEDTD